MSEGFSVGYWSIRGLAAPLRMMVMYRNVPLVAENFDTVEIDGQFDRTAWTNSAKSILKEVNPFINLPYVKDNATGRVVTQSNACYLFVGRKLNMLGRNEDELSDCEQFLCEAMDLRNNVIGYSYRGTVSPESWLMEVTASGTSLSKLNEVLARKYANRNDSSVATPLFFVGDDVSAADFHIWEMCDQIRGIASFYNCSDPFEGKLDFISTFHRLFALLPGNQRYLASKLYTLPANNISAKVFGATPSGAQWTMGGQDHFWKNSSGTY